MLSRDINSECDIDHRSSIIQLGGPKFGILLNHEIFISAKYFFFINVQNLGASIWILHVGIWESCSMYLVYNYAAIRECHWLQPELNQSPYHYPVFPAPHRLHQPQFHVTLVSKLHSWTGSGENWIWILKMNSYKCCTYQY